jgi:hypothetical protein
MKITRSSRETTPGPADWFTGSVERLACSGCRVSRAVR